MNKKRINPERLESVRSSYDDMSGSLEASVDFIGSDDASKARLAATTDQVKRVSRGIVEVVDSLDQYLLTVAEGFRQADEQLSRDIQYRVSDVALQAEKKQLSLREDNQFYPSLP